MDELGMFVLLKWMFCFLNVLFLVFNDRGLCCDGVSKMLFKWLKWIFNILSLISLLIMLFNVLIKWVLYVINVSSIFIERVFFIIRLVLIYIMIKFLVLNNSWLVSVLFMLIFLRVMFLFSVVISLFCYCLWCCIFWLYMWIGRIVCMFFIKWFCFNVVSVMCLVVRCLINGSSLRWMVR